MSINNIKYFSDKFYIRFDEDTVDNLLHLDSNDQYSVELSVFIHEFYHYLANITTFQGLRAFNVCFQDKIRIVTRLLKRCGGLDAFPLTKNQRPDCKSSIAYWNGVDDITTGDSALRTKAIEIDNSPSRKVQLKKVDIRQVPLTVSLDTGDVEGAREMVFLEVDGIAKSNFILPIAAIDEMLSSSIDEYLFETGSAVNREILSGRPFYPYSFFDELLHYYGMDRVEARYKIILAYKAIHGDNPVVNLIRILEEVSTDVECFYKDPLNYLERLSPSNDYALLNGPCLYVYNFINECDSSGRHNLANACSIIYERGRRAAEHLKMNPYYFIRPLVENDLTTAEGRQRYLYFLKDLIGEFDAFLQLKDKKLIGAFSYPEKNHLAFILATYEILEGLEKNKIVERTETLYEFDGDPADSDKLRNLPDQLPLTTVWHNALNELSLYALYLEYRKNRP